MYIRCCQLKKYVDSRAKTDANQTSSNFVIDLKESFTMPEDTVFTVSDVLIPCVWPMIAENINNYLYVLEDRRNVSHPDSVLRIFRCENEPGTYDGEGLAAAIKKALAHGPRVGSKIPLGYGFDDGFNYDIQFDPQTTSLRISKSPTVLPSVLQTFRILTDSEIIQQATQFTVYDDQNNVVPLMPDGKPRSINSVLGNFTAPSHVQDQNIPYVSKRIGFRTIKYVLLKILT